MNHWKEAETEYRTVLQAAPNDADILLGLADVLAWQQRFDEALAVLDQARAIAPSSAEVHTRRGRALRALGRTDEARAAFREALALDSSSAEAQAGLASLAPEPRHELQFGSETEIFNFAENAEAFTASIRSRLDSHWISYLAPSFQQRFAQRTGKFTGSVAYSLSRRISFTAGGALAGEQRVIARREAFFEYSHGVRLSLRRFVRGIEASYRQHWFWFRDARSLALTPGVILYLPRDWTWSVQIAAARTGFPAIPAEWRPSGLARLSFPMHRRVTAHLFYAVGAENFARVDQLGRFAARTWGGGVRYQFTERQQLAGYVLDQDRSQGRNQRGFGFSYGIRFKLD